MKRVWIAVALLLAVLAGTLSHSFYLNSFTQELTGLLEAAEAKAEQNEWAIAEELTQLAHHKWDEKTAYLHILLRHSETDEVYTSFREVAEFIQCQEGGEYSAANARLIAELELLAEAEQLNLKNIL